ncbi:ABC transporter permease [Nonomuraea sp. NPDC003214]
MTAPPPPARGRFPDAAHPTRTPDAAPPLPTPDPAPTQPPGRPHIAPPDEGRSPNAGGRHAPARPGEGPEPASGGGNGGGTPVAGDPTGEGRPGGRHGRTQAGQREGDGPPGGPPDGGRGRPDGGQADVGRAGGRHGRTQAGTGQREGDGPAGGPPGGGRNGAGGDPAGGRHGRTQAGAGQREGDGPAGGPPGGGGNRAGGDLVGQGRSEGRRRGRRGMAGRVWRVVASRWLLLVVLVAVWEWATRAAGSAFFPPPSTIATRMHAMWFSGPPDRLFLTELAVENVLPSLGRMAGGLAGGAAAGVALGLALGLSARVYDYLDGVLQFLRAIPPPALVTVFLVVFGFGLKMQLAFIMFSIVWPVLLNTADGARSVEPLHLDTGQAFRLSRAERVFRIVLPSALPKIFAGLRLALSLSLIVTVFAELLPGTTNGIGFQLTVAYSSFNLPAMWAGIVLLGVLGYLLNELFLLVERRVLAWHHHERRLET